MTGLLKRPELRPAPAARQDGPGDIPCPAGAVPSAAVAFHVNNPSNGAGVNHGNGAGAIRGIGTARRGEHNDTEAPGGSARSSYYGVIQSGVSWRYG
jgi:hypothetical protein